MTSIVKMLLRDAEEGALDWSRSSASGPRERARGATPYLGVGDAEVVAGIRNGEATMYERVYNAYVHPLFDFALAYLHERESAEDVVATVMANLWARRQEWNVRDTVETYLFGAVHREVMSRRRTDVRHARIMSEAGEDDMLRSVSTRPRAPDDMIETHDLEDRVWAAVDALPVRYRVASVLRWRREMEYDEIGDVLETSPESARQLVSRAVRMIRKQVGF